MVPQRVLPELELASQKQGRPDFFPWDQISGRFGVNPGKVFIDDFDLGMVRTLGAFLDPTSPVDETSFVLAVKGLKPEAQRKVIGDEEVIPVTFGHPEAYLNIWTLPGVFVRREGIEPDLTRYSQDLEAFRGTAPNTETVQGRVLSIDPEGPKELIQRQRAEAYNFTYLIDCIARYRGDANAVLRTVLPRFKQHRAVIVRDSLQDLNEYTAFLEGIDDLQEILGVTMKQVGYTLTVRVIGELDLFDEVIRPTAREIQPTIGRIGEPPRPVPRKTTDGLLLKTTPARVLGRICSHSAK